MTHSNNIVMRFFMTGFYFFLSDYKRLYAL